MPKNKEKRGKNENDDVKRKLILKDDRQSYAQVTCILGDVILVGLQDYQDDKADVILKYHVDEARKLKRLRDIPANINSSPLLKDINDELDQVITFDDRYNGEASNNDQKGLPYNIGNELAGNSSLSEEESHDDEDDSINFF
ncbi:unnamed protein product [Rotaria sp. Silwood1]|nr:unnamed protein product [Rotaria sp. Silwood1]CAF3442284.1 unnamed protein product [Rotaria sp. Silwood1]CAF4930061.1 unnamed protein product [Rotaria sp. Silwood1]